MSNERIASKLEGFDNQLFPSWLLILNGVYNVVSTSERILEELGRKIPGYMDWDRPTTADKDTGKEYGWFFAMYFRTEKGQIATLFPYSQDYKMKDGTLMDRSIAIHTEGNVLERELDEVLGNMHEEFYELEQWQGGRWRERREVPEQAEIPDLEEGHYIIS